jgi:hypothetical protein
MEFLGEGNSKNAEDPVGVHSTPLLIKFNYGIGSCLWF